VEPKKASTSLHTTSDNAPSELHVRYAQIYLKRDFEERNLEPFCGIEKGVASPLLRPIGIPRHLRPVKTDDVWMVNCTTFNFFPYLAQVRSRRIVIPRRKKA